MISRILISAGFFAAAFVGGREIAAPREGESARASLVEAVKQPVPLPVPKGNEDFRSMLDKLVVDEELPLKVTLLRWIDEDPEAAFDYALEKYEGDRRWQQEPESLPMFVIRRWALKDVRAAMQKDPRAHHHLVAQRPRQFLLIAEEKGETDPSLWQSAGRHLARDNVESAIQMARSKDPELQAHLLSGIARTVADTDPVRAIDIIEESEKTHPADPEVLTDILRNLARQNPELAAEQADENERWRDVYSALLAESDPVKAVRWFHEQGGRLQSMPGPLLTNLSLHLDNAPVDAWFNFTAETGFEPAEIGKLHVWYPPDTRAAVDTLVSRPASEMRDELLMRALEVWTRENPREAIHYAAEHLPPDAAYVYRPFLGAGESASLAALDVHLGAIATENAHEAATILTELPDRFHTKELATWIGREWSIQNPTEASQWAAAQPAGPLREGAVRGLLVSLAYEAPAEALEWADTLQDSGERRNALEHVMGAWKDRSGSPTIPAEIERLTALPDETKFEALRILEEQ